MPAHDTNCSILGRGIGVKKALLRLNPLWAAGSLMIIAPGYANAAPQGAESWESHWEAAICPFEVGQALLRVECGWLVAPENYEQPRGRGVRVFTLILRSPAGDKRADPVLFINGGPGGAGVHAFSKGLHRPLILDLVGKRDWIIFDQRGNGRSVPKLECKSTSNTAAVIACRDDLIKRGIDLSQYNSRQVARDADALRRALKIRQWNLYGSSYGSRVALTIARLFPSTVRSIVHDSGLLPHDQTLLEDRRGAEAALKRLMARCAADGACDNAYPALLPRFEAALLSLASSPWRIEEGAYDDAAAAELVYDVLFAHNATADFPARARLTIKLIDAIASRDQRRLLPLLEQVSAMDQGSPAVPDAGRGGAGARLSVNCNEEMPFESVDELKAARTTPILAALLKHPQRFFDSCRVWPAGRAPASENLPVSYSGPQLAFTGEFDASLSLFVGQKLTRLFPTAHEVVFRNGSHTQLRRDDLSRPLSDDDYTLCAARIAAQFFKKPGSRLKTSCARARKLRLPPKGG